MGRAPACFKIQHPLDRISLQCVQAQECLLYMPETMTPSSQEIQNSIYVLFPSFTLSSQQPCGIGEAEISFSFSIITMRVLDIQKTIFNDQDGSVGLYA